MATGLKGALARVGRALVWVWSIIWRTRAVEEARIQLSSLNPVQRTALDTALECLRQGNRSLREVGLGRSGVQEVSALSLYRAAIRYAALTVTPTGTQTEDRGKYPGSRDALSRFMGSEERLLAAEALVNCPEESLLQGSKHDRRARAYLLKRLVEAWLRPLRRARSRLALTLLLRTLLVVVAGGAVVAGAVVLHSKRNLAQYKPWRASSKEIDCLAVDQGGCWAGGRPGIFVHTKEEVNPWIEYDLGEETEIAEVEVRNARDCCGERAIPMVVEVSNDQKDWKVVSRRTAGFVVWLSVFRPVKTRYVRLRIEKRTYLHLESVEVRR